jgi:hypothetical protein
MKRRLHPTTFPHLSDIEMHLLYADDSGAVADSRQKFFVLGGLSVFERQPHWIGTGLEKIAEQFNPADPASVELHGAPMLNGTGIWRRFPKEMRVQAINDCLNLFVRSTSENRLFAVVVEKSAISPEDPVKCAFEQLCSRFDQFLGRLHKKGDTQRGLIIFDKSTQESTIQQLARDFRTVGHSFGQVRNLAEVPVFC